MMDWSVFCSAFAALVLFEAAKGIPFFVRGFMRGFRKASQK